MKHMDTRTPPAGVVIVIVCLGLLAAQAAAADARSLWVDGRSTANAPDGSTEAPYPSISRALAEARPGDTVVVRSGVYRESVRVHGGEPGKPVTLRGDGTGRVILTGCVPVEGWEPAGDGLWTVALDWKPDRLFVGLTPQPVAREPNEGWWRSTEAGGSTLVDPDHLREVPGDGGEVYVWHHSGNVFGTYAIERLDRSTGRITLKAAAERLGSGDRYWLQNDPALIDRPGEWAVVPEGDRFRLVFKPAAEADLARTEAPHQPRSIVTVRDAAHVRIEGLELVGAGRDGIEATGVHDLEIRRCVAYHNGRTGISLRDAEDSAVAGSVAWRNGSGISVSYSHRVTVEHNDVGHNHVDGVLVTWKSDDVTVRQNCIHHHLLWGHPDNAQVYRDVRGLRFEENLLLAGGQSLMMEETTDGVFEGNLVVGSAAYMLIFGHGNAGHWKIHSNTLAFAGYGAMNLTSEGYDVRENVIMSGHGKPVYGVKGVSGYTADRNVFWNTARAESPTIMAADEGWHHDFEAARQSTGQDEHSVCAEPGFRSAPVAVAVLDSGELEECTHACWPIRGGTGLLREGDYVEVNCDGTRRRVTALDAETITVEPPLAELPLKGWIVAVWGPNPNTPLDLRLRPDSPGAHLSANGGPVGSQIDVQSYLNGDFNGDGELDRAEIPRDVRLLSARRNGK